MLVKASIFATAAICAVISLSRIDYRELYNEMYPVNGLRRDVLNLCHEAKPTFIRALEEDRVGCYDGMPDPVERAIGWVRTSSRLAALRRPTPIDTAEKMLISAVTDGRVEKLAAPHFTGYPRLAAAPGLPCEAQPKALLAVGPAAAAPTARLGSSDDARILAAFGLKPQTERDITGLRPELPVLTLGGARNTGASAAASTIDQQPEDALGDAAPPPAASGCKTPA